MFLDAKQLEELVTKGTGRKNQRPFLGLGTFEVTLERVRVKQEKGRVVVVKGTPVEVPGKVEAYMVDVLIDKTTNPARHAVGSGATVYLSMTSDVKYAKNDCANAAEFIKCYYESLGETKIVGGAETPAEIEYAIKAMRTVLLDPDNAQDFDEFATRGCRVTIETKLPKATDKDGNPKKKAPTEDGILYKNWRPIKQTVEEMLARRAELDKVAA